jgi:hypothetical protein
VSLAVPDARVVLLLVRLPVVRKLRPFRGVQEFEGRLVGGCGFFFLLQKIQRTVAMRRAAIPPRTEPNITARCRFAADRGGTISTDPVLKFIFMISSPFRIPFGGVFFKLEGPILTLSLPDGSLVSKTKSMK